MSTVPAPEKILTEETSLASLVDGYRASAGVYDELKTVDGQLRPQWHRFVAALGHVTGTELESRWRRVDRILYENGLTHNVYARGSAAERPFQLDPIPLILSAEDWRRLESGLTQRARLLDAILEDCYGDQQLLRRGLLPSPLVLGSPQFLRPCHGVKPRAGRWLHYYAADIGRAPNGDWWVLDDRCELAVGGGYALENRIALRNCWPDEFVASNVQQLAGYFAAVRDGHEQIADKSFPRVVVLSSDPTDPGYFAHSYLARYQGYLMAEGADLTVRDNRVFLKTLEGLQPVDIIIRRIEGNQCDPLELNSGSRYGVPGLLEAVRAGNVILNNALGSGLAGSEGLMPYLPALSRHLLQEDLLLPSLATWWCGQVQARDYVLANLENLETRRLFTRRADKDTWRQGADAQAIELRGFDYLARERMTLSTAPVLTDQGLQAVPIAMRVFLASDGSDYTVMPGGLTRLCPERPGHPFDFSRYGGGKDTWVLADERSTRWPGRHHLAGSLDLRRTGRELPSRSADNLFWLGRYAERAEGTMRQLRSAIQRMTDEDRPDEDLLAIERVLAPLLEKAEVRPASPGERLIGPRAYLERQVCDVIFDPTRPYGLRQTLRELERIASLVRDRLSLDSWQILRDLSPDDYSSRPALDTPARYLQISQLLRQLDQGIHHLSGFSGMCMENMTRSYGWRFLDLGRRIERSAQMIPVLMSLHDAQNPQDDGSLILILAIADSFMTYRSRYLQTPQLAPVLDLLLLDETNPRSVRYQAEAIVEHLLALPPDQFRKERTEELETARKMLSRLQGADVRSLCTRNRSGERSGLWQLLESIRDDLPPLSDGIARTFFSHAEDGAATALNRSASS